VPDEVIRRRYERGLLNFAHRYRDAADRCHLCDNTNPLDRRAAARGAPASWRYFTTCEQVT
jgi:predicted ABC-type ATPase